jgi:ABC-2 type transport system ATP-binding protein
MLIELKGISKRFGKKKVLKELDLSIEQGEIFGLIGRSGCGKSTLMKILLGVYRQDRGTITLEGHKNPKDIRSLIGYTTQENSFYDKLTIYENMVYYANLYSINKQVLGVPLSQHINSILKSVNLAGSKDTIAGRISGGMKRRLDFAISMVHNPKILVLDEPTTGLDPILVADFWKIVKDVKGDGRTIIVSSHIFSELELSCDRVGIMKEGAVSKIIKVTKNTDLFKEFEAAS